MELKITPKQKMDIAGIDIENIFSKIRSENISFGISAIKKLDEMEIQSWLVESLEIEWDLAENVEGDVSRESFYLGNNRILVVKAKQLNIKTFLLLAESVIECSFADNPFYKVFIFVKVILEEFFCILDQEVAMVYTCLCREYFYQGKRFLFPDVYEDIRSCLKEDLDVNWSLARVKEKIDKLEEQRIVEIVNGELQVRDKINFY